MKIRIKYLNDTIIPVEKIKKGDWIDLRASEAVELKQGESKCINLGVAMELPEGYEAHIVPRSSTFRKWGIIQTNHFGVIDNTYCGDNDWWCMEVFATRDTVINKGERICQFRIEKKMPEIEFETVDVLGNKDRGGYGSTGTK